MDTTNEIEGAKYTEDGRAVLVKETTASGFLVSYLYEDDETGWRESDKPYFVRKVYDRAPTEKMDRRISELALVIETLVERERELRKKKAEVEKAIQSADKALARHSQLQNLWDFIDGKITHYVEEDWNGVRIIDFKDAHDQNESAYYRKPRLLTLYGDTKGNLQWNLNRYSDHSGCVTLTWPCMSLEEARAKASELILAKCDKLSAEVVKNADALKIELPEGYRERVAEMILHNKMDRVAKLREEANKLEAEYTSPPPP